MVNKVSDETKNVARRVSVFSLPDVPANQNIKAPEVKKAMLEPTLVVLNEIDRVVDDVNADLAELKGKTDRLEETSFEEDKITTTINYTVANNKVKSFMADGITYVGLTLNDVGVGFSGQVNFKVGDTTVFQIINTSGKQLKIIQNANNVEAYIPTPGKLARILVDSDDTENVFVWVVEA